MFRTAVIAAVLLAVNGLLHGVWSHRWEADAWTDSRTRIGADRIEAIPLSVGEWEGQRIETDALTLPEEQVGRGVTVRYVNRRDQSVVVVFLTCGPTDGLVGHTPRACYRAKGFACPGADRKVSPPVETGQAAEFWVTNFTKAEPVASTHLRVLWSWSDGEGWRVPGNPRRAFRASPALYKCYAIRYVVSPDEPLDGDPAVQLLAALLPQLDVVLAAQP